MLEKRLTKLLSVNSESKLIIYDVENIIGFATLRNLLEKNGYTVYVYNNVEVFRIIYEESIKANEAKIAVIVTTDIYVPYDICIVFHKVNITVTNLFPNLNYDAVMKQPLDMDLIMFVEEKNFTNHRQAKQTERFINDIVFSHDMVTQYCQEKTSGLVIMCNNAVGYNDWMQVAKEKASIEYYAAMKGNNVDLSFVDKEFSKFIDDGYSRLSTAISSVAPPIITRTLELISTGKQLKAALIIMDGMSLFDFTVLSRHFNQIDYDFYCTFAIIPTTTPISRQSLLSGKLPRELKNPFSLTDEEKEFRNVAKSLGYTDSQIEYLRGYDTEINPLSKLIAIIINDIDDIVHGQRQGRPGMYNDMDLLGKNGKIQMLITKLVTSGFSVYLTSDHGNTPCTGVGSFRSGVEVESKSKRMTVLKDFAEINTLLTDNAVEYPGYYMDKSYRYYVCKNGVSFDNRGEQVMTHGGKSIDEVIVPFIKIRGLI